MHTVGSHLSVIRIFDPQTMIFIDILKAIASTLRGISIVSQNISVIWTPSGPNVFG